MSGLIITISLFSLTGSDGFYKEIIPKWPNYSGFSQIDMSWRLNGINGY